MTVTITMSLHMVGRLCVNKSETGGQLHFYLYSYISSLHFSTIISSLIRTTRSFPLKLKPTNRSGFLVATNEFIFIILELLLCVIEHSFQAKSKPILVMYQASSAEYRDYYRHGPTKLRSLTQLCLIYFEDSLITPPKPTYHSSGKFLNWITCTFLS